MPPVYLSLETYNVRENLFINATEQAQCILSYYIELALFFFWTFSSFLHNLKTKYSNGSLNFNPNMAFRIRLAWVKLFLQRSIHVYVTNLVRKIIQRIAIDIAFS